VDTPVVRAKNWRMFTEFVMSSEPWSITLSVSSVPITAAVIWIPPVPQP
jgi:hypothetical protein